MAKLFSVVPLELRPGVKGEDFEKFWLEEYSPLGLRVGWESHLLIGNRGEKVGHYAVIWELPSVETRDRIMLDQDRLSEEGQRLLGPEFQVLNTKLDTFVMGWPATDYVELGK